jgi:hypothetical protein
MFPEGQQVEIVAGAFAGCRRVVVARERAMPCGDVTETTPDAVGILTTFWNGPLAVLASPEQLRAIDAAHIEAH